MGSIERRSLLSGLAAAPGLLYLLCQAEERASESGSASGPAHVPGPAGDFSWQGYEWDKRTWGGAPHYNGRWSASNVVPQDDGSLLLRLTNTGTSPVAAEIVSTRVGWGYGTYSCSFEADFTDVGRSMVWGSLFTWDDTQKDEDASFNEIDAGEVSAWGVPTGPTRLSGTVWGKGREPVEAYDVELASGLRFFRTSITWTPRRVSFRTTAGKDEATTVIASSVVRGAVVPVPRNEAVHFNIWAVDGNGGDPSRTPPFEVRLTSFSFEPFNPVRPVPISPPFST